MAIVKGVCKNIDDCVRAEQREMQEVEKSAPFVCEECGKPLVEVKKDGGNRSGLPKWIYILIGVVVLGGAGGGVYFMIPKGVDSQPVTLEFRSSEDTLHVGDEAHLSVKIIPEETGETVDLAWKSANPSVIAVDKGEIKALSEGESVISVKDLKGVASASCRIIVLKKEQLATSVEFVSPEVTLEEGKELVLEVRAAPEELDLVWESANYKIVTVDGGVVKAVKAGESTITVKDAKETASASCHIKVTKKKQPVSPPDGGGGTKSATLHLGYGKYEGEVKNGKANGMGTLTFLSFHRLSANDDQSRMAEAGDYFVGQFNNNEPYNGKWYDRSGSQKGSLITKKLGVPSSNSSGNEG